MCLDFRSRGHFPALLLCLLIYLCTSADGQCTRAGTLFKNVYDLSIEEMRRGTPKDVAATFFAQFKSEIGTWALANYAPDQPLGLRCVPKDVFKPLFNTDGSLVSFQETVENLKAAGYPPSYLPRAEYPILPLLSAKHLKLINWKWKQANKFLLEPPIAWYPINGGFGFPPMFTILHDPHQDEVCIQFNRWGGANGHNLTAKLLTTRIIGVVVRLHLLGVSQDDAFQMLLHHSAYIFNGMRCRRSHYNTLLVPLVFSEAYSEVAAKLTQNLDLMAVPRIPDYVITDVYSNLIQWIAYYKTWGTKGVFRVDSTGMSKFTTWKEVIFGQNGLDRVRSALLIDRQLLTQNQPMKAATLTETSRHEQICYSGWVWEETARWSTSIEEKCCSQLCYDTVLDESIISDNILGCCQTCNQVSCSCTQECFSEYITIVPNFGELPRQSVPIMIGPLVRPGM